MIRFFTALCKTILENLSDEAIFQEATDRFNHHDETCPNCGATGKLSPYGSYSRYLVSFIEEEPIERRVSPIRFRCASCPTTHALLPDILIPHSPYSIRFKLTVLIAYFERNTTVVKLCKRFGIAISTLYAWKKRFLEQKELLLGVLDNRKKPAQDFLLGLFESAHISECLRSFFHRYAFSFLQNRSITATESPPP